MKLHKSGLAAAMLLLVAFGCSRSESTPAAVSQTGDSASTSGDTLPVVHPSEPDVPPTADAAVRRVLEGIDENRPVALWEFLPPSYREEATELIRQAARNADREVWEKSVRVGRQLAGVLRDRKSDFLAHPALRLQDTEPERVSAGWDALVAFLDVLFSSELSEPDRLERLEPDAFLEGTGRQLMQQFDALSALASADPASRLMGTRASLVRADGDTAIVRIDTAGLEPAEHEFVRVEGHWIPRSLAENWEARMQDYREMVAGWERPADSGLKLEVLAVLETAEQLLADMQSAPNRTEFNMAFARALAAGFQGLAVLRPSEEFDLDVAAASAGTPPSGDSVTVRIEQALNAQSQDEIASRLKPLTDAPSESISISQSFGSETTVEVSPVKDVGAFARSIEFAEVVSVDGERRTVTIRLK